MNYIYRKKIKLKKNNNRSQKLTPEDTILENIDPQTCNKFQHSKTSKET